METGYRKAVTGSREELLGPAGMGGKRRRAVEAGGRGHSPGGQLLRSRAVWGGGGGDANREIIDIDM